jgi:glycosyltransferase involved in cell wall biosynthesis
VIPAYNEEDRIGPTLEQYSAVLSTMAKPWEIIVVMDGIRDGTEKVVDSFADHRVRKLVFREKLGKGGAVVVGLKAARYNYFGYVDADGSVPPHDIAKMIGFLDQYDCVIASRWLKDSRIIRREPVFNAVAGRFYNFLVRSILFLQIRDTQCGAKFLRSEIGRQALMNMNIGFTNRAFEISLLYHVRKMGGKMFEVPVEWSHDDRSRMPIGKAIPVMFLSLLGVRVMNSPLEKLVPKRMVKILLRRWKAI